MQTRFSTFSHDQTDTVVCPKCGNCGVISWDLVQTANGTKKDFAGITGNFYERLSKQPPYPIELVCTACSVVVPQHDKAQSPIRNGGL